MSKPPSAARAARSPRADEPRRAPAAAEHGGVAQPVDRLQLAVEDLQRRRERVHDVAPAAGGATATPGRRRRLERAERAPRQRAGSAARRTRARRARAPGPRWPAPSRSSTAASPARRRSSTPTRGSRRARAREPRRARRAAAAASRSGQSRRARRRRQPPSRALTWPQRARAGAAACRGPGTYWKTAGSSPKLRRSPGGGNGACVHVRVLRRRLRKTAGKRLGVEPAARREPLDRRQHRRAARCAARRSAAAAPCARPS